LFIRDYIIVIGCEEGPISILDSSIPLIMAESRNRRFSIPTVENVHPDLENYLKK